MRFRAIAVGMATFTALSFSSGGFAWAAATTETNNTHQGTETFVDVIPCLESLGDYSITVSYNGVEHVTSNSKGEHFTFTQTGTFQAVPVTGTGETFSGRFTVWGGGNLNPKVSNFTFTFRVQGTGSAGTTFKTNDNAHVTTSGPGDPFDPATPVRVAFEKARCR